MIEFLSTVVSEIVRVFYEGSLYILLGFLVAGLLHEFLPTDAIARQRGSEKPRSVVLAALFGAPIPLCSCGVLPATWIAMVITTTAVGCTGYTRTTGKPIVIVSV